MLRILALLIILYFAFKAIRGLVRAVRGDVPGPRPPLDRRPPHQAPGRTRREVEIEDAKFRDLDG